MSYEVPKVVDSELPCCTSPKHADSLGIIVQYAKLCARINRQSIDSTALFDTLSALRLLDDLRSWYHSVPGTVDGPCDPLVFAYNRGSEGQLRLATYFQYHEALLMIEELADKKKLPFAALAPELDRMARLHEVCRAVKHAQSIFGHRCVFLLLFGRAIPILIKEPVPFYTFLQRFSVVLLLKHCVRARIRICTRLRR